MSKLSLLLLVSLLSVPAAPQAEKPYTLPNDTVIILQRGNCEALCPVYKVVIFPENRIIWYGIARVRKVGVALGEIEPNAVREIVRQFKAIDYFNLKDIYRYGGEGCRPWAGESTVITSISMSGLSKTMTHYHACVGEIPDKLTALENSIDRIAKTDRWIK